MYLHIGDFLFLIKLSLSDWCEDAFLLICEGSACQRDVPTRQLKAEDDNPTSLMLPQRFRECQERKELVL